MKESVSENVFKNSNLDEQIETGSIIKGPDLNEDLSLEQILEKYATIGFQATHLAEAVAIIKDMLTYRLINDKELLADHQRGFEDLSAEEQAKTGCRVFLSCTSNVISSGLRELIKYLVQHKLIDVLVISAGGIEEDLIKCWGDFYLGSFEMDGRELRERETNRIGNILVPNERYVAFADRVLPVLDACKAAQDAGFHWTPSRLIWKLGKELGTEDSVLYWAERNGVPVFCPAVTDGALGDCLCAHTYGNPGLLIDVVGDVRAINELAASSARNGVLILGGGSPKHHVLNACLFSEAGADYAVYVNCGLDAEGSDSGAPPSEALSWGKIAPHARPVKVFAELSLVLPILVHCAFKSVYLENKEFFDNKILSSTSLYWRELEEDVGVEVEWL